MLCLFVSKSLLGGSQAADVGHGNGFLMMASAKGNGLSAFGLLLRLIAGAVSCLFMSTGFKGLIT